MADPRPQFVLHFQRRGVFHLLFVLCLLYAGWFAVVLVGESQDWGDDPGAWAGLPTAVWGYLGIPLFALFLAYALGALTIREQPARVVPLEGGGEPQDAPQFLQEPEIEAEAEETPPEPGQD